MENYNEMDGDLISLALEGYFDVITHGCNCFCSMGAGIAPQMADAFGCDEYKLENTKYKGDINKLGQIDWHAFYPDFQNQYNYFFVVNSYTQFYPGKALPGQSIPLDYEALTMCFRKIGNIFKGKHIGLPKIGAGLAGGNWDKIKQIIEKELLPFCDVTVVNYKPKV